MCFAREKQEEAEGEGRREARKIDENQGAVIRKEVTEVGMAVCVPGNERQTEEGKSH